jgi:hypothetical protein
LSSRRITWWREARGLLLKPGSFRWLFLETAMLATGALRCPLDMLATGALRCPLDREGLLGAQTNSPRRPTDGCRAEELPWRPTAPTQALSSLRNSLRQRGPGRSPLRGAGRAGSPKSGACRRSPPTFGGGLEAGLSEMEVSRHRAGRHRRGSSGGSRPRRRVAASAAQFGGVPRRLAASSASRFAKPSCTR